eukprot:TRINITY_DN1243_c0_g1_i2.p1 TRINITY_DN1243_c0_g1~~TRINITY_DN1243_c0_g1_i2.p1  ORF type:complete len:126 (+),score=11.07 TRINITY_DN1243_c0_g1_i2:381-758(+)
MPSVSLSPERASLGQSGTASGWLAQNSLAVSTDHDSLGMAKNSSYIETSLALHIHEKRVRCLDETLELVPPLLKISRRIQKIHVVRENHFFIFSETLAESFQNPRQFAFTRAREIRHEQLAGIYS